MKKPAGVIFDLGDTLLHSISVDWIRANEEILEFAETKSPITPEALQDIANAINRDFE